MFTKFNYNLEFANKILTFSLCQFSVYLWVHRKRFNMPINMFWNFLSNRLWMYGLIALLNKYDVWNINEILISRALCPSDTQRLSGFWSLYNIRAIVREGRSETNITKNITKNIKWMEIECFLNAVRRGIFWMATFFPANWICVCIGFNILDSLICWLNVDSTLWSWITFTSMLLFSLLFSYSLSGNFTSVFSGTFPLFFIPSTLFLPLRLCSIWPPDSVTHSKFSSVKQLSIFLGCCEECKTLIERRSFVQTTYEIFALKNITQIKIPTITLPEKIECIVSKVGFKCFERTQTDPSV